MRRSFIQVIGPGELPRVMAAIEAAIAESFRADRGRQTGAEIKRRFEICVRLIQTLRADLGWGLHRVLDHLPRYLRCELDGQKWEPDKRTIWVPGDGN